MERCGVASAGTGRPGGGEFGHRITAVINFVSSGLRWRYTLRFGPTRHPGSVHAFHNSFGQRQLRVLARPIDGESVSDMCFLPGLRVHGTGTASITRDAGNEVLRVWCSSCTGSVKGIYPAPDIHEHLPYTMATENCVHLNAQLQQTLSTLRLIA